MRTRSRRFAVVIWGAALCVAPHAWAQTTVTACGADNAAGGVNLRDAVAAGGRITFNCGAAPATIKVAAPLQIVSPTQIDGEARITLQGPDGGSMFASTAPLELANIQVRNDGAGATGIVRGPLADVVLRRVGTSNTPNAYVVATLIAEDSTFESNGTPGGPAGVIIDAERVQLSKATFNKNFDHPIGGGQAAASRAPLSRRVDIDGSTFNENAASVLAFDASVTIRNSRFSRNGVAAPGAAGSWACCGGALTAVNSRVAIFDSEFVGNNSAGTGGAVLAVGTDLRLVRSLFQQNQARAGGAVFSWAQPLKNNVWSAQPGAAPTPALSLSRARFRQNTAQFGGGAVAWSGAMTGDSALFAQNQADAGGAIAHPSAITLPAEFGLAFSELVASTMPVSQSLSLARGVFVENQARVQGAAISGGNARVALGNALVIRNSFSPPAAQGAAIEGNDLDLANGTIADNAAGGVKVPAGGQRGRIVNTVVLRNASYGCDVPAAQLAAPTASVQFPGNDCAGMTVGDAALDGSYKPVLGGPASTSGNVSICISEPLVAALDLASVARGNRGVCATGAYEPDPRVDPLSGWSGEDNRWVRCTVFWLVLFFFMLGFICVFFKKRRRKQPRP